MKSKSVREPKYEPAAESCMSLTPCQLMPLSSFVFNSEEDSRSQPPICHSSFQRQNPPHAGTSRIYPFWDLIRTVIILAWLYRSLAQVRSAAESEEESRGATEKGQDAGI